MSNQWIIGSKIIPQAKDEADEKVTMEIKTQFIPPATTLEDAIKRAVLIGGEDILERVKNELRDYFAHEIGRMDYDQLLNGGAPPTALELFKRAFKDVPAFKTVIK